MTSTFKDDEDRNLTPSTIAPGGDFGETDSPDSTAPDISSPLSSPASPEYPRTPAHSSGFSDSDMRGLAEHGYDGTGNLKSAVDYDETSQRSPDSDTEEYSDGSFREQSNQAFSSEGLGQTPHGIQPGSVMREDDGVTIGPGLTPTRDDNTFTTEDRVPSENRDEGKDKDSGGMMGNLKDKLEEAKEGILGGNKK